MLPHGDMGLPIKISEALALAARTEAEVFERSIASQVEHWAQIGRAVEQVLGHDQVAALKRQAGMPEADSRTSKALADGS